MTDSEMIVYIVDDDVAARHSLGMLMETAGIEVKTYVSATGFLDALDTFDASKPGCLVLDIRMPKMSGLELQQELNERGITMPVIFITGHGDVPLAVRAMRNGAMDFFEKPFSDQDLLDRIMQAITKNARAIKEKTAYATFHSLADKLSPREKEVMELLVTGKGCKAIASLLGISPKTVHVHRSRIMEKMEVRSLIELVHLAASSKSKGVA